MNINTQTIQAYKQGGESFRKHCLRYGTVASLVDTEDVINGKPVRHYLINIGSLQASITMVNGDVTEWEYK